MVMRSFQKSESGSVLTEGLIVFPIMLLAISVCLEFGYMMHKWEVTAKAMQLGVRRLIVTQPVAPGFATTFAFNATAGGQLIGNDGAVSSCGAGTGVVCNTAVMGPLIANLQRVVGTNDINANMIRVTYQRSGLGYNGRPRGPVVSVRMEMSRGAVPLPILGALLTSAGVRFPPFVVTATSEDLCGTAAPCS